MRQARFSPSEWSRVQEKADELKVPAARFIALATLRALGPLDGVDALSGDLAMLRDVSAKLEGGT